MLVILSQTATVTQPNKRAWLLDSSESDLTNTHTVNSQSCAIEHVQLAVFPYLAPYTQHNPLSAHNYCITLPLHSRPANIGSKRKEIVFFAASPNYLDVVLWHLVYKVGLSSNWHKIRTGSHPTSPSNMAATPSCWGCLLCAIQVSR